MKKFRKNINELFVCEECLSIFKNKGELAKHINKFHDGVENYYNKWIKEEKEELCKICFNKARYKGGLLGYSNYCSRQCAIDYNTKMRIESYIKRFGSKSPFGDEKVIIKSKNTKKEKYGNEYFTNPEKNKLTCLKKYGVTNGSKTKESKEKISNTCLKNNGVKWPMQSNKSKKKKDKTCLEKYGTKCSLQNKEVNKKSKKTMIEKYGVEYSTQNLEIFKKQQKSGLKIRKFNNTDLYYQGSYELDFLEKYYNKYPDIKRGLRIKYKYKEKIRYYFSDFYIPSKNLIIEIKNSYLANKDIEILKAKEIECRNQGYNWIIIVNKNYKDINL